jgi:hypothetical protein
VLSAEPCALQKQLWGQPMIERDASLFNMFRDMGAILVPWLFVSVPLLIFLLH